MPHIQITLHCAHKSSCKQTNDEYVPHNTKVAGRFLNLHLRGSLQINDMDIVFLSSHAKPQYPIYTIFAYATHFISLA